MGGCPAHRRHTSDCNDYWLRSDRTGIYRIASRNPLDRFALADEPHRYVLGKPYQAGTNWQATTTAYVLQRPQRGAQGDPPHPQAVPDDVHHRVDGARRSRVPAGTFDACMRVDGQAALRVYVDAQFAWRDIPLTHARVVLPRAWGW